jgi:hypothetical protein
VGGVWQGAAGLSVTDLNRAFPPTVPASCLTASWGMSSGPALALDARGKPLVVLTAAGKAFGGQCGTGSMATSTHSFLALP